MDCAGYDASGEMVGEVDGEAVAAACAAGFCGVRGDGTYEGWG